MSVTNHNHSGRGLPGPILGIQNLRPGGVGGSKCQKCGKFHELPRKSIKKQILPKK